MTDAELDELERLAEAATRGPWRPGRESMEVLCDMPEYPDKPHMAEYKARVVGGCGCCGSPYGIDGNEQNDRAFIIASRTAVPQLIALVRRLRAAAQRLTYTPGGEVIV